jgi:hypothetical protein
MAQKTLTSGESGDIFCGVVAADGLPTWVQVAYERGWNVHITIVRNNGWVKIVSHFFTKAIIITNGNCEKWLTFELQVSMWLSDVDLPKKLGLFYQEECKMVTTSKRARNVPPGWSKQTHKVSDVQCGGAMDGE